VVRVDGSNTVDGYADKAVVCGPGRDRVRANPFDTVDKKSCERIIYAS
jgi:hypothetical protein